MQDNDQVKFVTILTGIADYYGKTLAQGVIELYWQGLRQYDIEAVEKALWEHTQNPDNGQFMPKIADVTRTLQGRTQDQASIAWSKVDAAVRKIGTYRDVVFDDGIIHRVLSDMGGWIGLGMKTEDDWPFVAREFENRYRGYKLRGEVPEYPPLMLGIANAQNAMSGMQGQEPVLIGKAEKAQQVLLGGTDKPMIAMTDASEKLPEFKPRLIAA
ncbi:DUF6475 domain-containing protein [Undibacterium baiyunense]|uniref:DUF6475 domain-containing protein n=1 Tax=Undibacterium baiyunense TaxID=2828731 RepID=A0A941DIC0_9BURK|nr:DUF6475 domain-containing protein [Undibacterium baiyunense]MBR7747437.1 hypothetical protein [Undibacterium baiyunense]